MFLNKRKIILAVFLLMFTSSVHAALIPDFFGTNKKKRMAFANQIVSEVLTPEEINQKQRQGELIQADGDYIYFIEVLSGNYPNFEKALSYHLDYQYEKKESSHEDLLRFSRRESIRMMNESFREKGVEGEGFSYKVLSENPRDIVYIAKGESKDPNNDFGVVYIVREARVGKWKFSVVYLSEVSKLTLERQEKLIKDLINLPTVNNWISNSRKKGL